MPTYIIRGWEKEALIQHEFSCREASRGNNFSVPNYYARAKEFPFEARGDGRARQKADKEHPELVGHRELLKVIPL